MNSILSILTAEEKAFIKEKGLSPSDFYDARGETQSVYHEKAKAMGCNFVVCMGRCGHRLKTRSGHCIMCNTAYISFQKRNSGKGKVYIAFSGKYTKVGLISGTSKELLEHREYQLNSEGGYGSRTGWQLVKSWNLEKNAGKVEDEAHRLLQKYKANKSYIYSGEKRDAQEIFECSIQEAIDAVKKAILFYQ
jgi:hypothetical protein